MEGQCRQNTRGVRAKRRGLGCSASTPNPQHQLRAASCLHRNSQNKETLRPGATGVADPTSQRQDGTSDSGCPIAVPTTVSGDLTGINWRCRLQQQHTPSAVESCLPGDNWLPRESMSASRVGASSPDADGLGTPSSTVRDQSLSFSSRELPWSSEAEPLSFVHGFIRF